MSEEEIQNNQPLDYDTQSVESSIKDTGTITVGRQKYAVGLVWQPLQDPEDPHAEIREALDVDPLADLYCIRITSTSQYGIAKKAMGHKPGEISAAATVASALSNKTSVCCVFKVPEGWWFVAIRNDLILSENDVLYKNEEEAEDAFFSMMAVPDWDLKIVPSDWKIEGTVSRSIESVFKETRTKVRLEELESKGKNQILLIFFVIAIIALLSALYAAMSFIEPLVKEEKIEPLPIPDVIKPVEPTPEKPKPWEKIPQTEIFLHKCWNNAYQLRTMQIPGWEMGVVTCTYQGLSTRWAKGSGPWSSQPRIGWVKAALNEYKMNRVNVKINQDGISADGNLSFHDIPLIASVPFYTEQQLWEELTDIKQATNINISFQRQTVLDPPNNPDGSKPENQQEYVFYSFSVTSSYTPFEWLTFFKKFPGLEINKIEFNPAISANQKWKYEGRIYAK